MLIKTKTIWYILLGVMIFSSMMMTYYRFVGLLLFGVSAYAAGAYHIKWRLEKDTNEYDKLLNNEKNK